MHIPMMQRIRKSAYLIGLPIAKQFVKPDPRRVLLLSDSHADLTGNLAKVGAAAARDGYQVKALLKASLKVHRGLFKAIELCIEIARAGTIFLDDFYPIIYPLALPKETRVVQLWHASGAFKQVGFARLGLPGGPSKNSISHRNYTDAIVSGEGIRGDYARSFRLPIERVHATGMPKTDVFSDHDYIEVTRRRVRMELGIAEDATFVLFTPTFRGNGQKSAHYPARLLDWGLLANLLPENIVVGVKMHPFVIYRQGTPLEVTNHPRFRDLGERRDIDELMMASDMLVTDYSSAIFDYSLLEKPMVFYTPDIDEYVAKRSFYYSFEHYLLGQVTYGEYGLAYALQRVEPVPEAKLAEFRHRFCSGNDGNATERVVKELLRSPYDGWQSER